MSIKDTMKKAFGIGGVKLEDTVENRLLMEEFEELCAWEAGDRPDLRVVLSIEDDHIHVQHGRANACIGEDTDVLTKIGYKINVWHRRDYLDVPSGFTFRLRPRQVRGTIATGALYSYGSPTNESARVEAVAFSQEPQPTGGDTRVRILAPSGHWAEGESYCADDDVFDKALGRSLALQRALENLNGVVHA